MASNQTNDSHATSSIAPAMLSWRDRFHAFQHPSTFLGHLVHQLTLALIYLIVGEVSYRFSNLEDAFNGTFYLHEGYALAVGAAYGVRSIPSIFLGHFALVCVQGLPLQNALLSATENVGALWASIMLLRFTRFRVGMARPVDLVLLVLASLVTYQTFGRLAGYLALWLSGKIHSLGIHDIIYGVTASLIDESIHQVLVATTILTSLDAIYRHRGIKYWVSGLSATGLMVIGLILILGGYLGNFNALHILSVIYIAVMAITFGFGLHGASLANFVTLVVMQWAISMQVGPLFTLLASQDQQDSISTILIGVIISTSFVGALLREKQDKELALIDLATKDSLTGLFNRRYFFDIATHQMARVKREDAELLLICLDLDHFKSINDTHGHATGDEVLTTVGEILRTESRQSDVAARMGGEEFAILAPNSSDGEVVAERLRAAIRRRLETDPNLVHFTVSVGVTAIRPDDDGIADALKRADEALYEAKRRGRDCVVIKN